MWYQDGRNSDHTQIPTQGNCHEVRHWCWLSFCVMFGPVLLESSSRNGQSRQIGLGFEQLHSKEDNRVVCVFPADRVTHDALECTEACCYRTRFGSPLQLDTTSVNASVRGLIRAGLIYGLTYSLVSIDIDQEWRQDPGITEEDMFNREELRRRMWEDVFPPTQAGKGSFVRTNLTDTLLRSTVQSSPFVDSYCFNFENQPTNVDTGVAYGFVSNDWQSRMLSFGLEPTNSCVIPGSRRQSNVTSTYTPVEESSDIELFEKLFIHAAYLYIHEVQALYEDSFTSTLQYSSDSSEASWSTLMG